MSGTGDGRAIAASSLSVTVLMVGLWGTVCRSFRFMIKVSPE
ncbi:MAG: hypothetical protein AAF268_04840 [Cyanobacteria bacterium P01_A01_bin.3]